MVNYPPGDEKSFPRLQGREGALMVGSPERREPIEGGVGL